MARTAFNAPAHRVLQRTPTAGDTSIPVGAAPSLDFLGHGIQDHRLRYNTANSTTGASALGWYGSEPVTVINQVPSAIAANNIATAQHTVAGTALTLVSSTGAGITVISAAVTLFPSLVSISSGLYIDAAPARKNFGTTTTGVSAFYDRTTMIGRAVSITGVSGGGGATSFLASGYDVYGYAMSELIAAPSGAATVNGTKAFKVISSVVATATDGSHNYTVGTADIFGFGLYGALFSDVQIYWNSALITATTGFTAGVTTTATTTTGDVRGTYAVQDASDASKRLVVRVFPGLTAIASNSTTGLFGVAQA